MPDRGDTANAWDGSLATDSYVTPSNNQDFPSYLLLGFNSASVNHLRIYKH